MAGYNLMTAAEAATALVVLLPPFFLVRAQQQAALAAVAHSSSAQQALQQKQRRQLAWVLSLVASALQTLLGLRALWLHVVVPGGFEGRRVYAEDAVSHFGVSLFVVSMSCDLLLGLLFYREHIDPLNGWVHHTLYVALGCFLQSKNASISLALAFPEELPTFILALGTVVPSWRSDTLFGWTFFATRLLYHGWYLLSSAYFSYFQLDSHERSSRDHVAVLALSSAMILHIFWFSNWMAKRHSYRYKKQQELQRTHMISPVPAAVDAPPVK